MNYMQSWNPTEGMKYYSIQRSLSLVLFLYCNINRGLYYVFSRTRTHKHTRRAPSTQLHEWFRSIHIDYLPPALGSAQTHLAAAGPAC